MVRVLYPGSFDPLHNGHLEIIETASRLFSSVVVAAVHNPQKNTSMFDLDERKAMISESAAHLANVEVTQFSSLVVELAEEVGADAIVKGLRSASDFDVEIQMAHMNNAVTGVETIFFPASPASTFLASKYVRDISRMGGDVTSLVPPPVAARLRARFGEPS